jgi:Fe-S cluster biogenesis protein NfuA
MSIFGRLFGGPRTKAPAKPWDPDSYEARVERSLEALRPALRADGGDVELVGVDGRSARVRLTGACNGCASAGLTLRFGIEKRLREEIPEFEDLIPV